MDQIGHGELCCSSHECAQGSPAQGHTCGLCAGGSQRERGSSNLLLALRVHLKKKSRISTVKTMQEELRYHFWFLTKVGSVPINSHFSGHSSYFNCTDVSEQIGMDPKIKIRFSFVKGTCLLSQCSRSCCC